jgi:hypothetical protein
MSLPTTLSTIEKAIQKSSREMDLSRTVADNASPFLVCALARISLPQRRDSFLGSPAQRRVDAFGKLARWSSRGSALGNPLCTVVMRVLPARFRDVLTFNVSLDALTSPLFNRPIRCPGDLPAASTSFKGLTHFPQSPVDAPKGARLTGRPH